MPDWSSNTISEGGFRGCLLASALALLPLNSDALEGLDAAKEIRPFALEMVKRHGLESAHVEGILQEARVLPEVLTAIERPAEAKPWKDYRAIFLVEKRISAGVQFWLAHEHELQQATERFGVPASVVVAIIGVESLYGARSGRLRVLDSLATLAFRYPRRQRFFRSELEQFLLVVSEEKLDILSVKGSYAGAIGIPQFIPSSYRHYAVDFDGDGVRDLVSSRGDAIGSVANYLARHGWVRGATVAVPARVGGPSIAPLVDRGVKPHSTLAALRRRGVEPALEVTGARKAALIELQGIEGAEHWLGFENFYAITRYNHSKLYAMAVHQLAEAIAERRSRNAR